MSDNRRVFRVAQAIHEQLAARLLESSDDRFQMVTITGVKLTKDLRLASVYWVQAVGQQARIPEIQAAFEGAKGYFRNGIAEGLRLRFVPELRFFYDNTLDTVAQIDELMKGNSEDLKKNGKEQDQEVEDVREDMPFVEDPVEEGKNS
ncbi:MAG: 30S ribosome-binding factor RbfA [Bdellovibrionales bacterium]|nr:30S ribosome-binding factor RbfA [Bdellovibrionales bacterium]